MDVVFRENEIWEVIPIEIVRRAIAVTFNQHVFSDDTYQRVETTDRHIEKKTDCFIDTKRHEKYVCLFRKTKHYLSIFEEYLNVE